MNYANSILSPEYFQFESEKLVMHNSSDDKEDPKPEPRYENKYLEDIKKLDKEFKFDNEEEVVKADKYIEFISILKNNKFEPILGNLNDIEEKLANYEKGDDDYCISDSEKDGDEEDYEEQIRLLLLEKENTKFEIDKLQKYLESNEGKEEIMTEADELARKFIINKRLEKLNNCYVMEKTPLGNVLMIYNNTRSSFSYYSDSAVPYRYLETVARKYVKTFACRPIFVDMDEELIKAEEKWESERKEKERNEEEEKKKIEELKSQKIPQKKSVFAKFKSYNKDSAATKAMAAPPKNSIPNNKLTSKQENEKILLKDKANRYTYEGKLSNFNFLKKVERKVVDKKYALSFADFKKLQMNK